MIPSAFLHDIGKPIITFQDEKNKITGEYSFYNHEELSYQVIKS
ncbi:HD domain-containing protein [Aliarcobacter cryaerophilus]|jgi:CRISPR/Cas system-associated endonuclease Cas3-HD